MEEKQLSKVILISNIYIKINFTGGQRHYRGYFFFLVIFNCSSYGLSKDIFKFFTHESRFSNAESIG